LNSAVPISDPTPEDLRKLEILAMEEREREGYERLPQDESELLEWDAAEVWPEDSLSV
jgi:hypothetical protein